MIYPSEILNNMIHEVEKAFPLETPVFPTSNINDLIENPDYPDDEGRECGEPFLNQCWIDVPAIQWYYNAEFVSFATSCALAYFLPSIIRHSYLEEIANEKRYMSDTREWMMNVLTGINFWGEEVHWRIKTTNDIYHSYTKKQFDLVRDWILFENRKHNDESGCTHALDLVDRAAKKLI